MSFPRSIERRYEGVATANADDSVVLGEAPNAGTVTAVSYTPDANVAAGDGTNNRILRLINRGAAGAGTTEVASLTSNANAWVGGDEEAFTLSATPANLVLAEGDILSLTSDANGTGVVDPGGLIAIAISPTVG